MSRDDWRRMEAGLLAGIRIGSVSVPHLLLTSYARLKLTETEVMLLIHLIAYIDKEKNDFPTIEEIQQRMSVPYEHVIQTLQKLLKQGFISIDEETEPASGIRYEKYNLEGMWRKLASFWAEELKGQAPDFVHDSGDRDTDLYSLFEKEFARPLTPLELETITKWLDEDRFPEELIVLALKEAVFSGKVHFNYIDRILLEWNRNRVFTAEQAKEHAQRFRGLNR